MTDKSDFTFFHPLRVRWAECDMQAIVFNVNYFLYFDVGMTEYMRALKLDNVAEFFTAHAEADYKAPAKFDEELQIGVRCARIGRTSMTIEYLILRDDQELTIGHAVYVHADEKTQVPAVLPPEFVAAINKFEKTSPEAKVIA